MKTIPAKVIQEKLGVDQVTKSKGVYTLREGFRFYTHGRTPETYINKVLSSFPEAKILESRMIYKAFRGGASLANSSHFLVKFTI